MFYFSIPARNSTSARAKREKDPEAELPTLPPCAVDRYAPTVFMFVRPFDDFRELKGVKTEVLRETFFYEAINTQTKTFAGHYSPSWK